jgi:hypothetical protein
MGTDVWLVRHELIYDHLDSEELDFIMSYFDQNDDGTFCVTDERIEELPEREKKRFKRLLNALKRVLEKEDGWISISLA